MLLGPTPVGKRFPIEPTAKTVTDLASPDRPEPEMRFLLIAAATLILTLAPGIRAWSSSEEDPWMQGTVAWNNPIKNPALGGALMVLSGTR